ncbi:ShKT domain-containing protein [Strongyloides ratti]|uniref:ShKT domain-containing protein n=1 Tax=Strongyloides ratti TaxID=34506 RepID=A0A090L0L5_STRRB|nr:ShKT domain-containing protein [Strongyloides ratti]CEF63310.1 ShKT domain-containing protein [Strongyloides ratti]
MVIFYLNSIGSSCTLHKDCDSGVCTFTGPQQGYCVKMCKINTKPSGCDSNVNCTSQADNSKTEADGCTIKTKECAVDGDCKSTATPICNQYMLKCEAEPATTTVSSTKNINNLSTKSSSNSMTTTKNNFNKFSRKPSNQNICQDKVVGGQNDCIHLARFCTNTIFKPMMTDKCPRTCGFCNYDNSINGGNTNGMGNNGSNGKSCIDKLDSCYRYTGLCKSPQYEDFMKKYCPSTCGC